MPAPHWVAPVPALLHTSVPFGVTVQPCDFSSEIASLTLNGYGLISAFAGVYGLFGSTGTGP